ncbi:hypothetical protein OPV22_029421 [Ensete ventricosum]|uniref:PCI domain-containing protein n=1 Tax=Ensete ventricosum TaxID=4639 RepID=A0AAV8QDI2_ENSVE|nr:hypothetical protein OPV22_029421 [Ensete ventricosum]
MDQRELFHNISSILKDNKRYLATFSGVDEDADTMNEAKEEAIPYQEARMKPKKKLFMLSQTLSSRQISFSGLPALKIIVTQRLDAYLDFHAANSTLLQSYGLVHEDCITKMRLMSLLDLSSHESGEIPYSLIRDTLQITDHEVEYWVVKAITSKLLDCKTDQINQVVIVSRHRQSIWDVAVAKSPYRIWCLEA